MSYVLAVNSADRIALRFGLDSRTNQPGPRTGQILAGKFELQDLLREDPLGEVYKATPTEGGAPVAVQILAENIGTKRAQSGNFEADLEEGEELDHPDLAKCIAFDLDEDPRWVAWSYVPDAISLQDVLSQGPLTPRGAAILALRVVMALQVLHEERIFHRNLHPNLILLSNASAEELQKNPEAVSKARVLLAGWAQAHLVSTKDPIAAHQKKPEAWLGYPEYFAPEQAQGRSFDERSDIYAVGVLLYHMLTGKPPFTSSSFTTTLKRHIYEKPLLPRIARPGIDLPEGLEEILLRMLSKKPHERYESTQELLRAFNQAGFQFKATQPLPTPEEKPSQEEKAPAPEQESEGKKAEEEPRKTMLLTAVPQDLASVASPLVDDGWGDVEIPAPTEKEEPPKPSATEEPSPEKAEDTTEDKASQVEDQKTEEPSTEEPPKEENTSKEAHNQEEKPASPEMQSLAGPEAEETPETSSPKEAQKESPEKAQEKTPKEEPPKEETSSNPKSPDNHRSRRGKKGKKGKRGRKGKSNTAPHTAVTASSNVETTDTTDTEEKPSQDAASSSNTTEPQVTELKGRKKSDLAAPSTSSANKREKTRKVKAEPSPSPDAALSFSLEDDDDGWFATKSEDLEEITPDAPFSGKSNTPFVVAIILLTICSVGAFYFWSENQAEPVTEDTTAAKLQEQEKKQEETRNKLFTEFDGAVKDGRLFPPAKQSASSILRQLKTQANAANTDRFKQSRQSLIKKAEETLNGIDVTKNYEEGVLLAQSMVRFDPSNKVAEAFLKRPAPAPPTPVADAGQADLPDEASPDNNADAGSADADLPTEEKPGTPENQTGTEPKDNPEAAGAEPTQEAPAAAAQAETPKENPPKEAPSAEDTKAKKKEEAKQKKEEARKLLQQASKQSGSQAINTYRQVLKLQPNNHRAHYQVGVALSEKGDYNGAIRHLERAVRYRGRNAQYRLRLGNAYRKTSQNSLARKQYEKVLEIDPNNRPAQTMLKRL